MAGQVHAFTTCSEIYKINGEETQVHSIFCIMALETVTDPHWLKFVVKGVKTHWNYVFVVWWMRVGISCPQFWHFQLN